jgi:hypothetical protein
LRLFLDIVTWLAIFWLALAVYSKARDDREMRGK